MRSKFRYLFSAPLVGMTALTTFANEPASLEAMWEQTLERPIEFHQLVDDRILVAGTGRHLYGIDPQTGEIRWRERNVNPNQQDVYRVNETGALLVTDSAGGQFDDSDTHVLAINADDGLLLWESPRLAGKAVQGVITEDGATAYVTTVVEAHGDDRGVLASPISGKGLGAGVYREPTLASINLHTGELLWQTDFGREIRMQPAVGRFRGERPFDFGNYHRPVVVDRMLCITYLGIRCLNRFTGATVWDQEFPVIEDTLALAYARPLVVGEVIYTTGDNRIRAFDRLSGDKVWRSKRVNVIPELLVEGDTLYAQLGGRFFHLGEERWKWKGEFGVVALNRHNGKTHWRFDDAKGAMTNLHVETDRIWFADEHRIYAIDRQSGKRLIRQRHRMNEAPVFTVINRHGHRVLISDDEVAAFDLTGRRLWSIRHPAPGPGAWGRASAQLFQLSGQLLRITSMAVSMTSGLIPSVPVSGVNIISGKSVVKAATRSAGNQLTEASDSLAVADDYGTLEDSYQYFLTTQKNDERIFLASVDINAGRTVGLTPLPSASPDIVIDDERGMLLQAEGQTLTSLPIR
jgi:outer membrane protein assembly factor BamB